MDSDLEAGSMRGRFPLVDRRWGEYLEALRPQLREARERLRPPDPADVTLEDLDARLNEIERRMSQRRYRVGFMGRSQIGKSTAVANVLELSNDESPTGQGVGNAATSAPTRVYALPLDSQPTCIVHYMTRDRYRERYRAICDFLDLPYDPQKPEDSERYLAELRADTKEGRTKLQQVAGLRERNAMDIAGAAELFAFMIASEKRFGTTHLTEKGKSEVVPYGDRRKYTNHPEKLSASPQMLVFEVEIGYPTEHIHHEIEMIDLPGLGTKNPLDDIVTKLYLPDLAGAMVYRLATQGPDQHTGVLFDRLKFRFGEQMKERVWLCLTHFSLGEVHLKGSADDPTTFFDNLSKWLSEEGLNASNLNLVSKTCYDSRGDSSGRSHRLVCPQWPEEPGGGPARPAGLARQREADGLWEAVLEAFKDGGIGRMRSQLVGALASRVKAAENQWVARRLSEVCNRLRSYLDDYAKGLRLAGEADARARAEAWQTALRNARDEVLRPDPEGPVDKAAKHVAAAALGVIAAQQSAKWNPEDIYEKHDNWMQTQRDISEKAAAEPSGMPAVYAAVESQLSVLAPGGDALPIRQFAGVPEAWQALARKDLEARPWSRSFSDFTDVSLFPGKDDGVVGFTLQQREYRALSDRVAVHRAQDAADETASRVAELLGELDRSLGLLTRQRTDASPHSTSLLLELCARLRAALPCSEADDVHP